ncbi:MAG: YidB family protein [Rickettsiales bacterium]
MSLLSNLVSGAVGATVASVAKDYIQKQGGLQAVIAQFEQNGLGEAVKSWVGTGPNLPISGDQLSQVLGGGGVFEQLAAKLGVSADMIKLQLAEHLPQAVDTMTPDGVVPAQAA